MGKPVTTTDGIRSDLHGRRSDLSERAGKLYKNTRHAGKLSMKHRMRKVRANRLPMSQTAPASPGGGAVDARLATLMTLTTPAPGGGAVDARLATLMLLTPAPKRDVGGSVHHSEVYGRRLYLV